MQSPRAFLRGFAPTDCFFRWYAISQGLIYVALPPRIAFFVGMQSPRAFFCRGFAPTVSAAIKTATGDCFCGDEEELDISKLKFLFKPQMGIPYEWKNKN